ncbi:hypothetical protein DV515_00015344 [Chloebia gouldiae]|uniref:Kelch domain-containing protein 8A n=1 Tax=Chloebia gouldiae TaxID=44316 RepID=A0A3L8RVF9_CHLGU|nr:hypothetical protein DV515_00015344 [Chloebia gouldiae]
MDRERREFARTAPRRSPAGETLPALSVLHLPEGEQQRCWIYADFFFSLIFPSSHAAIPSPSCSRRRSQPGGEWEEGDARRIWENPEHFQPCSTWRGGSRAARSLRELLRRLWSRRIDGEALKGGGAARGWGWHRGQAAVAGLLWGWHRGQSLAPLPSRRVYSTLVEAGGQVFAVGGCDDNGIPVDSFEVYSPEADQWASLPAMPTARAGVAVTVLGKRIMVIGGVGADQLPLKVVEMYNTDEGRWRKRSSLREAAMGISVTAKGKCWGRWKLGKDVSQRAESSPSVEPEGGIEMEASFDVEE